MATDEIIASGVLPGQMAEQEMRLVAEVAALEERLVASEVERAEVIAAYTEQLAEQEARRAAEVEALEGRVAEREARRAAEVEALEGRVAEQEARRAAEVEALEGRVAEQEARRAAEVEALEGRVAEQEARRAAEVEALEGRVAEQEARRAAEVEALEGRVAEQEARRAAEVEALEGRVAEQEARRAAEVEALEGRVAEQEARRAAEVEALEGRVAEREARRAAEVEALEGRVAEQEARRAAEVEALEGRVAEREARRAAEVEALEGRVAEQEARRAAEVEALEGRVAEREARRAAEVEALEGRVAEQEARRAAEVEALEGRVAEREARRAAEVEALEGRVAEQEARRAAEVEALEGRVAEQEARRAAEVEALEGRVAEQEARRAAEVEALEGRVAEQEARRAAECEALVNLFHNSLSWRITAPLRSVGRVWRTIGWRGRGLLSQIVRIIYHRAPLPFAAKVWLKESLFTVAPRLFWHTAAYRDWTRSRAAAVIASREESATSEARQADEGAEQEAQVAASEQATTAEREESIDPGQSSLRNYYAVSRTNLADRLTDTLQNTEDEFPILFDPTFYLDTCEDIRKADVDPLEHYLRWGAVEGRMPLGDIRADELYPLVERLHRFDMTSAEAAAFDADFYRMMYPDLANIDDTALAEHYDRHGRGEQRMGSPYALIKTWGGEPREIPLDFDPDEYFNLYLWELFTLRESPMALLHHYMEHGRWQGKPYSRRAFRVSNIPSRNSPGIILTPVLTDTPSLCVLVHVYYPELWDDLADYIGNLPEGRFALYVNLVDTTFSEDLVSRIRDRFPFSRIHISENRGRDIGGFVRLLENIRIEDYQVYGLLHTKKSPHVDAEAGKFWRHHLLGPLMGTRERAAENIALMLTDRTIGEISASSCRRQELGKNHEKFHILLDRFGIGAGCRDVEYATGVMGFLRADVLQRVFEGIRNLPFEDGSGKSLEFHMDGQWEHAVERVIGNIVRDMGYRFEWR